MRAKEVVDLSKRNDNRNTRGKTGNNRRRHKRRQFTQMQDARDDQNDAAHQSGNEHALHAMRRNQRTQNGRHRTRRTRDLIVTAGQQRHDNTCNNRGYKTSRRRCTCRHTKRKRKRQCNRRNGHTSHQVFGELLGIISPKLHCETAYKVFSHVYPLFKFCHVVNKIISGSEG